MPHAFIIYSTHRLDKPQVVSTLQEEFGSNPSISVDVSRAPEGVDEAYAAQGPHDIYLSVKPARTLSQDDQDRLIAAVRATAAVAGGTFCPVKGGNATKDEHKHFVRFWKNK